MSGIEIDWEPIAKWSAVGGVSALGVYFAYKGDTKKTLEHMKLFAQQDNYMYWTLLFLKIDPLIDPVKDNPEFQQLLQEIDTKFWKNHIKIKASLEEKGLL